MKTKNTDGTRTDAVETVAFLARSEHRVHVLELLADGTRTRETLLTATGVARVTLSRILGDLEERGWIEKDGNEYALTEYGGLVYDDLARLLGTVSLGESYPDIVGHLPTEWFGFDARHLAEGSLVADEHADPLAAARTVANAVRGADTVRALVGSFVSLPLYAYAEAMRTGDEPDAEIVFGGGTESVVRDDDGIADCVRAIEANAGTHVYYSVEEPFPCNVDLVDDETVYLSLPRERGGGFDVIECDHPAVREWARERFERTRTRAAPYAAQPTAVGD
ncbi:putative transcriptional regulator [Halarchaeum rubridurum]|uniref:Putative transcriptional regulator n=1 Tax=Halarchaeum rubridurum TaxID=489911 RepID=A0A830G0D3_9EURY|nr:ArsR family transcriptional regulator [Halarchaeum rubridurum]MBP1955104.1 putative transcriptional regulator [Halarchaeum rubridurum]GGM68928.1 hypothetical protein GCM10009017_18910 [Halarchaeum rubridurum]